MTNLQGKGFGATKNGPWNGAEHEIFYLHGRCNGSHMALDTVLNGFLLSFNARSQTNEKLKTSFVRFIRKRWKNLIEDQIFATFFQPRESIKYHKLVYLASRDLNDRFLSSVSIWWYLLFFNLLDRSFSWKFHVGTNWYSFDYCLRIYFIAKLRV